MEALLLVVAQAVSMPPLVARSSQLRLLEVEMLGLLTRAEPQWWIGVRHRQLRQSEEEVETAGRFCCVYYPWADDALQELLQDLI